MALLITSLTVWGQQVVSPEKHPVLAGCTTEKFISVAGDAIIKTIGNSYTPKCLRIKSGSNVTIQASSHHPLTAFADVNDVQNPFGDQSTFTTSQTRVMSQVGIYGYYCEAHGDSEGDGMAGIIIVEP